MTNDLSREILALLQSKNRCLDRLMDETRGFLQAPIETLIIDGENEKSPLSIYENERGVIIHTLEMHDRKINSLISDLVPSDKTEEFMAQVKEELLQNERLIHSVFNADDIVFSRIRDAQNQISKLLQENRKSRELLSKFKSGTGATGEAVDKTL